MVRESHGALTDLLQLLQDIRSESESDTAIGVRLKRACRETARIREIMQRLVPPSELSRPETGIATGHEAGSAQPWQSMLTSREHQVLALISAGASNKEGALGLQISVRTFEAHRAQIMHKLGARNVAALVRMMFTM